MAKSPFGQMFIPITKRQSMDDGSVIVEGPVTDDSLDLDGQIVDPVTAAKALQEWFDGYANIRQQHSATLAPAGRAIELSFQGTSAWIKAKIVEPVAVKLVNENVYQGFSIGIADGRLDTSVKAKSKAPNGILFPTLINEVSVVDYPANKNTKFVFARKSKDGTMQIVESIEHGKAAKRFARALKRDMSADERKKARWHAGKGDSFPIDKPEDVAAAASSIGRAGPDNYSTDRLKRNIIRIARKAGPEFEAKLPESWKDEMGKKATKGKGKGKIPKVDQDVTDALDKTDADLQDAKEAQDRDNSAHESGKDSDDKDMPSKGKKSKKGKKGKMPKMPVEKGKKGKKKKDMPPMDGDDEDPEDISDAKKMKGLKKLHDLLCPACTKGKVKAGELEKLLDEQVFAKGVASASEGGPGTIAAATRAYFAAHDVKGIGIEDFNAMRTAARKAFMDAYPNMPSGGPDLMNPDSFRRGFLPGATSEVATSMNHPGNFPTPKPLKPEDFDRGPLSANETRPSLAGGHSVARKSAGEFYPQGVAGGAMSTLHDTIAANYPSICPAGSGLADEVTDRLGTPPEMYSPAPMPVAVDTKANATPKDVEAGMVTSASKGLTKKDLKKAVRKATKSSKVKVNKMRSRISELEAQPDDSQRANRAAQFAVPDVVKSFAGNGEKSEALARARELSERIHDRANPGRAAEAMHELQGLGLSAEKFAEIVTAA